MDNYELEREAEEARKRARNAQADLEQKELDREREERAKRHAQDRAAAMTRQLNAEREEHEGMIEGLQSHVSELQDRCNRLAREREALIGTLRALVAALPSNQAASLIYFGGTPLAKSCAEAVEVLRVVDAQKAP